MCEFFFSFGQFFLDVCPFLQKYFCGQNFHALLIGKCKILLETVLYKSLKLIFFKIQSVVVDVHFPTSVFLKQEEKKIFPNITFSTTKNKRSIREKCLSIKKATHDATET